MTELWIRNLLFYSLQIAVLALAGGLLLRMLRIGAPKLRLACWHLLLAACVLLPALQPWSPPKREAAGEVQITTGAAVAVPPGSRTGSFSLPVGKIALGVITVGTLLRLGILGLGFLRLRRYRRTSRFVPGAFAALQRRLGVFADVQVSGDIGGPVTFGLRRPVILMPEECLENSSIACHELVHVRRRDWVFTVLEEMLAALYWFHPAVWWLVAEIQLAREEAVDREVVALMDSREQYLESLLALAAARAGLDLAPASPFLRKRHLQKRVASLMKEITMSKLRLSSSLAMFAAILALAGWLGVRSFPLQAAPQDKIDAPGVTVQAGPVALLHRTPVVYPREALSKKIQGTVVVEATLSDTGTVTDARVLSGPEELRKAALQSVLQWHYSADSGASSKAQISIDFKLPPENTVTVEPAGSLQIPESMSTVKRVMIQAPAPLKDKLQQRVMLREGDALTAAALNDLTKTAKDVDEHVNVNVIPSADKSGVIVTLAAPGGAPGSSPATAIRIGGNLQSTKLVHKVAPVYPQLAKQARIQGVVRFMATIGKDGRILDLETIVGHPLLVEAARSAVLEWTYEPTLLNGNPVDVKTQIDVNFTLADDPPAAVGAQSSGSSARLVRKVTPAYPAAAKEARIQGVVRFLATIGKDGRVLSADLVSGHPLLVDAARDALLQWVYEPTLLNGEPVEIKTQVDINFTLSQ